MDPSAVVDLVDARLALAIAAALVGGALRGFSGFGGAIFMVPTLSLIYDPTTAVVIVLLSGTAGSVQLMPSATREARWREILPIVLAAAIANPVGTHALLAAEPETVRRGIGVFVLASAFIMMRGWAWRWNRPMTLSIAVGGASGFITGIGGMGGALPTLYLIAAPFPAAVIRSNLILIIGPFNVFGLFFLWLNDAVTVDILLKSAFVVPVYLLAIWVGSHAFRRSSESFYRRAALWLLIAVGIGAVIS